MADLKIARVNESVGSGNFERQELSLSSLPTASKTHSFALPLCLTKHESDQELQELTSIITVTVEEIASQDPSETRSFVARELPNQRTEERAPHLLDKKREQETFDKCSGKRSLDSAPQSSQLLKKNQERATLEKTKIEEARPLAKETIHREERRKVLEKSHSCFQRIFRSHIEKSPFFSDKKPSLDSHQPLQRASSSKARDSFEKKTTKERAFLEPERALPLTISKSDIRGKKEREGGGDGQGQEKEREAIDPEEKKKRKVEECSQVAFSRVFTKATDCTLGHKETLHLHPPLASHTFSQRESSEFGFPTAYQGIPQLALPQIGPLALYYILTKIGILSDNLAQQGLQQEIEELDREISKSLQERIAEMKEVEKKEKSTKNWDIMTKVMSWITSFLAIFTGVVLIATGAGAFAGAMAVVAGVISLTNHILEVTGTWKSIAAKLAEDNPEKARAIIMWMQISIAVISFVLLGTAVVFGGLSPLKGAMGTAGGFSNAIAGAVIGVLLIGKGISEKFYNERMARLKEIEKKIMILKQEREDDIATAEEIHENSKKFWEELFEILRRDNFDTREIHAISRGVG